MEGVSSGRSEPRDPGEMGGMEKKGEKRKLRTGG